MFLCSAPSPAIHSCRILGKNYQEKGINFFLLSCWGTQEEREEKESKDDGAKSKGEPENFPREMLRTAICLLKINCENILWIYIVKIYCECGNQTTFPPSPPQQTNKQTDHICIAPGCPSGTSASLDRLKNHLKHRYLCCSLAGIMSTE